jgi:hypothetical protein
LLLFFAVNIVNRAGWIKSLPIFLALIFANFYVTQFSMQFFPIMAIALIGGTWMCRNGTKPPKKIAFFLFVTGMFTAYFDLLTIPILALGVPLIVYLILQQEGEKSTWDILKSMVVFCLFWLIGYASAWAVKWVLAAILIDSPAIANAFQIIKYRISTEKYTRWDAIMYNISLIPIVWLTIILALLFLLTLLSFNKKGISKALLFLLVGVSPYVWYGVLSNHSYIHWWFTYRAQIISMSCAMLFFVSLIDWEQLKLKLKIKKNDLNHD